MSLLLLLLGMLLLLLRMLLLLLLRAVTAASWQAESTLCTGSAFTGCASSTPCALACEFTLLQVHATGCILLLCCFAADVAMPSLYAPSYTACA
jgi:hypothetical protein